MPDKTPPSNVTRLFEAAEMKEVKEGFPSDEKTITEDLRIMARVYFERMVDTNIDLFMDQIIAINAVRKPPSDVNTPGPDEIHRQSSKYLLLARESLISFLLSVNGFEGTLKHTADAVVQLEETGEVIFDQPIYNYVLSDKEEAEDDKAEED